MYNNRLENNFVSGQDAEVIKRTRSERQSYEELAKEFREKLKSTISTSELEKLSKGTNASLKTIQSAILVQGTYMKQIAGSLKNIENMQKKILQASMPSFKAPTMKKVTDKDRLDIIGKSKGFTDFNKSVSDFGSSLNKLIEAQKSNNNEVLAALGMVPKNTSDIITKAFGKFMLENPRMVTLFRLLDRTIGTGARWIFDLGKELGQFNGGFFHKVFGLLSLRQRGAWTNEINYNPAMPLQSIMSTLNAIHKNVWIMNHDESAGGKKKSSELYMEKGGLKAFLDQIPAHYKRIAAAFLGISAAYWPSATAQIGLWLPKIAARTVAGIFTNKAVWGAFTTFLRSPLLSLTVASSLNTAWESIFTRNRERRDERERERRTRETTGNTRRFVAGRNSIDNDAWFDNHDRSRGYGAYILEEIRNGYNKFWERGISKTVGNIWDAMFNQSALRAKRNEAEDKDREKYYNDIRYKFLDMINEPGYRTNIEYFISNAQNSIEVISDLTRLLSNPTNNVPFLWTISNGISNIRTNVTNPIVAAINNISGTGGGNNAGITLGDIDSLLYGRNAAMSGSGNNSPTASGDSIFDRMDVTNRLLSFILRELRGRRRQGLRTLRRSIDDFNNATGLTVTDELRDLLIQADDFHDAIIGPNGEKIADPFGKANNSSSGSKRSLPPILVQEDGRGGVDLSIFDRGDNIVAVQNGSPMSQAIYALRNMSPEQLKRVIESIGGFASNVLTIKGHPVLGGMMNAATMTGSGLVSAHQFINSDYTSLYKHEDAFGNTYETKSLLTADMTTVMGNVVKAIGKGGEAAISGIFGGIKAPFTFMRSLLSGGSFKKNFSKGLSNIAKFLESKATWENLKEFFSLSKILKGSVTYFIKKPYQLISTAISKSIDYVSDKIGTMFSDLSTSIAAKFVENKAKNLGILGGFLGMFAVPNLIRGFGGEGLNGALDWLMKSDVGNLLTTLLEAFGGNIGGFITALKLGNEYAGTITDIATNGFDMKHIGEFGWTAAKSILGSIATIVTGKPSMMSIVGGGMDFARDILGDLYEDVLEQVHDRWGEFMYNFEKGGFFGENTARSGVRAAMETLVAPFGQSAMNLVGDWTDGALNWYDEKMLDLGNWWEETKDWAYNLMDEGIRNLGLIAHNIIEDFVMPAFNTLSSPLNMLVNGVGHVIDKLTFGRSELGKTMIEWSSANKFQNPLKYLGIAEQLGISVTEAGNKKFLEDYRRFYEEENDPAVRAEFLNRIGKANNVAYRITNGNVEVIKGSGLKGVISNTSNTDEYLSKAREDYISNIAGMKKGIALKRSLYRNNPEALAKIDAEEAALTSKHTREATAKFIGGRLSQLTGLDYNKISDYVSRLSDKELGTMETYLTSAPAETRKEYIAKFLNDLASAGKLKALLPPGVDTDSYIAQIIDKQGPEYAKLARYVQNNTKNGKGIDIETAKHMADFKRRNIDINNMADITAGSKLESLNIKFDNGGQRRAVLEQLRKANYSFEGKDTDLIRSEIERYKDSYNVSRVETMSSGQKKNFMEAFQEFLKNPAFRAQVANILKEKGLAALEELKKVLADGIDSVSAACGIPKEEQGSLEGVINEYLGNFCVMIARMLNVENPESYRNFIQAKYELGKGYIINIYNEYYSKLMASPFVERLQRWIDKGQKKTKEYKSSLMKASNMVSEKLAPYISTVKGKLSEGADTFKGFISNLFGQIGFGDMFSGLSGLMPSLGGLFGGGSSGGGIEASIASSPGAKAFAQQSADFVKTQKFKDKMKARLGSDKYNSWTSIGQKGYCARGLKEVLREQGVLTDSEANRGGDAYQMDKLFDGHKGFVDVTETVRKNNINPASLPPGYVVVMDRSNQKTSGHVFMTLGNGMELSDHVQKMNPDYRKSKYGGIKRVYAIKKAGIGGDMSSIESELSQSGAITGTSSSVASGSSSPSAIPTAPYTTGVDTVLPNTTPDSASDEAQKQTAQNTFNLWEEMKKFNENCAKWFSNGAGTTVIAPDNSTVVNNSSTVNSSNNVDNSGASNNSDRYAGMRNYQNMGFQFASSILQ